MAVQSTAALLLRTNQPTSFSTHFSRSQDVYLLGWTEPGNIIHLTCMPWMHCGDLIKFLVVDRRWHVFIRETFLPRMCSLIANVNVMSLASQYAASRVSPLLDCSERKDSKHRKLPSLLLFCPWSHSFHRYHCGHLSLQLHLKAFCTAKQIVTQNGTDGPEPPVSSSAYKS